MQTRITRVAIKNYRSIGSCDVELQPLTLLVGPNGSGKSNFLDALRFIVHSMHAPTEQVVEARSGMRSILRKLPKGQMAPRFSVQLTFEVADVGTGTYLLSVAAGTDGSSTIDEERCQIGEHSFVWQNGSIDHNAPSTPAFTGDRPALVAFGALPQFAPVFALLSGLTFYAPNPERMRRPTAIGPGKVLSRDGSNCADVLARIERSHPQITARIREYLRSFNPEFAEVSVTDLPDYRWLAFTPAGDPSHWRLNSADVSDGTLRAIAILLAIFQAPAVKPPLTMVGLEEPESNLHPAAAGILLDALLEASRQVPILASTHSADLLDRKDLPETAILAVTLQEGETLIGPIDESGKTILRKRLYTAGELLRSNRLAPAGATSYE
ncbi:MAG: AAA family ATPase [Bryobacterales bacterium]|nr:AAA family ATPase [Bryobacterales bacterium]